MLLTDDLQLLPQLLRKIVNYAKKCVIKLRLSSN
jgi:hypothetical protein